MAKVKSIYVCSECGFESPKWYGKCPSCGEWNTLNEELPKTEFKGNFSASLGAVEQIMSLNDITGENDERFATGIDEFDRELGGGIVKGSLVLFAFNTFYNCSQICLRKNV